MGRSARRAGQRRAHFEHARGIARRLAAPHWEERASASLAALEP
ncbi:hypothetical protein ACL02T_12530 [Pseudonocardia sp. RS010]